MREMDYNQIEAQSGYHPVELTMAVAHPQTWGMEWKKQNNGTNVMCAFVD